MLEGELTAAFEAEEDDAAEEEPVESSSSPTRIERIS
jgi:hypothetical protein